MAGYSANVSIEIFNASDYDFKDLITGDQNKILGFAYFVPILCNLSLISVVHHKKWKQFHEPTFQVLGQLVASYALLAAQRAFAFLILGFAPSYLFLVSISGFIAHTAQFASFNCLTLMAFVRIISVWKPFWLTIFRKSRSQRTRTNAAGIFIFLFSYLLLGLPLNICLVGQPCSYYSNLSRISQLISICISLIISTTACVLMWNHQKDTAVLYDTQTGIEANLLRISMVNLAAAVAYWLYSNLSAYTLTQLTQDNVARFLLLVQHSIAWLYCMSSVLIYMGMHDELSQAMLSVMTCGVVKFDSSAARKRISRQRNRDGAHGLNARSAISVSRNSGNVQHKVVELP